MAPQEVHTLPLKPFISTKPTFYPPPSKEEGKTTATTGTTMTLKNNKKGFTLIEILVVIMLLSSLVAITVKNFSVGSSLIDSSSATLMSAMGEIETSFGLYLSDKNQTPATTTLTGLTDTTFVPAYIMVPNAVQRFDATYGTSGYLLKQQTGQAIGNNGWYVSTRVTVSGSSDIAWQAITKTASKLSVNKFFYNTSVPALTNMAAPSGTTTVYVTYWITRS